MPGAVYSSGMRGTSGRHDELASELIEWWEDLWQRDMTSRVVLVAVPPGWGRTTALDQLAAAATADDAPVTLVARINGKALPEQPGLQAAVIRECLVSSAARHKVAELLGLDRLAGITQLALGGGGLFISGLAAAIGFFLAGIAAGAAGKAWDDSPAGADGALARTARAVAETSTDTPVIILIDDADHLDHDIALTLTDNLAARHNSHVLIAAAVDPAGDLKQALLTRARQGLTEGLVHVADASPDMSHDSRLALAAELCPHLPDTVLRRIARVTATFADVFAVTAVPRLSHPDDEDEAQLLAAVDAIAATALHHPDPSPEAVITAWVGGTLHTRQAHRALVATGLEPVGDSDPDLVRIGNLQRVTGSDTPRYTGPTAALAPRDRHAIAAALLAEALHITTDPACNQIERIAAAQAAHHTRHDLPTSDRATLPAIQRQLTTDLEQLSEPAAALTIAITALTEWPTGANPDDRDHLAAAVLRLSALAQGHEPQPVVTELLSEAIAGGASLGLEARVWAATELLHTTAQRETALTLTEQVAAALDQHATALSPDADHWRLLLAYHAGTAGYPELTSRLLAPLLTSTDHTRQDAANAVLHATDSPRADTRLQSLLLEAELAALPDGHDEDRLRIHHALALNYETLGQSTQALQHGYQELNLRTAIQGVDHPDTLTTRARIATWTGHAGDPASALRLFTELLPDVERVLGPRHPETLATRSNIAVWTGQCGDAAGALRLFTELLPDVERVFGPRDSNTLLTRGNLAVWTRHAGDPASALRLFTELLPDMERVLGPRHPDTLNVRSNIATLTGKCGDPAGALRLDRELLPDRERVLGPDHPDTLNTRGHIADWTGDCGDAAGALQLLTELLPDLQRALGPDHPHTLLTRGNIAGWTGNAGDPAGALCSYQELLPDLQRVLGPDHPETLTARGNIGGWTGNCGDPATALQLLLDLLPDLERVLGPRHPETLHTRSNIATLTGTCGDPATALQLLLDLLPDLERVLGPRHPETLHTRSNIAVIIRMAIQRDNQPK